MDYNTNNKKQKTQGQGSKVSHRSHTWSTLTYLTSDLDDAPHRVVDLAEERLEGGVKAVTQQGVDSGAQLVEGELGHRGRHGACACVGGIRSGQVLRVVRVEERVREGEGGERWVENANRFPPPRHRNIPFFLLLLHCEGVEIAFSAFHGLFLKV